MDYFKEAVKAQHNERAWVTYIKAKVTEQNQSFPCLMVGQTGSGKSWSTLRLCQELEPDFQLDGNWFFRAVEFYKEFTKYYKEKMFTKKAKIWVMDEAGVDFSSDEWQSKTNKIFAKVFSTARFRNYIFFGTVPFTDFISKKIRKLMQYRMTANYTQKFGNAIRGVVVPRCLQWSEAKDDFYYHKLVKILPDGDDVDINRILMPQPCKRLRDEYEKRRESFSDNLDSELLEELEDAQDKKKKQIIKPNYQRVLDGIKACKKQQQMAEELNISAQNIAATIFNMRKQGWDFAYNKEGNKIYNPHTEKWEHYLKKPEVVVPVNKVNRKTKNLNSDENKVE